jgi:phosphotransferase system  glucose/maltose/N-acetylglucosamine-specific IIC component
MGLIDIIVKFIQRRFDASKESDKKTPSKIMIQLVLLSVLPILYTLALMPPGVTAIQVIYAGIAFLLIVLFTLRVLKYFKIM